MNETENKRLQKAIALAIEHLKLGPASVRHALAVLQEALKPYREMNR